MIQTDELYDKVLERLDLSQEVDDRQLEDLIHTVLEEVGRENYLSLKEKAVLGRELFNAFRKLDILQELIESKDAKITERALNELAGHTPLQVACGAILGFATPFLVALIPAFNIVL